MGDADREDAKSLDSSDGGAAAENNSDMVHLEEEEEEDEELQTSVLDLQLSSEEFKQIRPPTSLPVFRLEPPSATSTPPPSAATEEPPYAPPGLLPPSSVLPPVVTRDVPSEEDSKAAGPADLPALLCGGAALVAAVGVMAYCAVAYCKK